MGMVGALYALIKVDTRQFESGMSRVHRDLDKNSRKFQSSGHAAMSMGKMALAAIPGLGLLAYGVKSAGEAAIDAEEASLRLGQALQHVGAKAQQSGLEAKLGMMQYTNAIDDERLSGGLARLIQSTGNVDLSMRGVAAAADLAAARNISFESAQAAVGKALIGSNTALQRMGIHLKEGATRTQILDQLQKKFGGDAEKQANGARGAWAKLGLAWDELKEGAGAGLLVLVKSLADWMRKNSDKMVEYKATAERVVKNVAKWITNTGIPAIQDLATAFRVVANAIGTVVSALQTAYSWAIALKNAMPDNPFHNPGASNPRAHTGLHGGHATGGTINPGAWSMVGERGPEMIRAGSSPVHVTPSGRFGGAGGLTIVVTGNTFLGRDDQSANELARILAPRIPRYS